MGNSSSATLGGATATEVTVSQPPTDTETDTMASPLVENNPNYWRHSHNKVLPDNFPGIQKSGYLRNGPRFVREHCEPRMRGRLYSPYGSPMSSACISRMDKENYGAVFDANSPDSTLYRMSSRFNSRMPSVTASRMVSALNTPIHSGMTSRATSRRSSFSRGNYIRRKKRHAPLPPANGFTSGAGTPDSFSSSSDHHVRRKFRQKRQAPGPPLQRTWSEKSIEVPAQISEVRAEVHPGPPPEPAADYDDDDDDEGHEESTSVKMETSPPPEEFVAAPEEPHQPEEQEPQQPPPEVQVSSPQREDMEETMSSDHDKTDGNQVESEALSMSTEQVPSEPEVPDEPKPSDPPPPPPPPLPGMGAPVITPQRSSEVEQDVPQKVRGEPAPTGVTMRQLRSQDVFAAELLQVFKARESRVGRGTLRMKRTSKSLVYKASITKKDMFKKPDVANGDIKTPVVVKQEVVHESPHRIDSEAWVPADDLSDDTFDEDDDEPANSSPGKRYTKKEKGSPANGHMYRKNDAAKPSRKSSKYNSLSKLKNSMRTAFGSIGKGIKSRKKIDEVFDVGVDNDSGEKWEIYPAGDYDEVPDGPIKVDHVEKCAAYAYQASTGELVLLPNYDRILVTADGRRIREADITKVNKPKWLKRLPTESEKKKPVVEVPDPPKVDTEKEREQQTKLEDQFAEVRFLNQKFQSPEQNGMPRTLSHDELLRLVSAKIPPPSPDSDTETTYRWSFEEPDSGMLDQYFVDMSTYSLDRNNNSKKSKSKKGKKAGTWGSKRGSKSKRPSVVKSGNSNVVMTEKTVSSNPVYSSGGEDDETEEKKTPAAFTLRANSHESSSTKDSGYKTERDGSDRTDQSSTTPEVSPASTLEARPSGPTTSMANTLTTQVPSQPQPPAVANPQQPMFAQPPQWYPAWPTSMPMTTPQQYAPNTGLFNPMPMASAYNPGMYNPFMQPMVNGFMNPGVYPTLPTQTVPSTYAATQNMAVSMSDTMGNNISLASTLPLPTKSKGVTTPPALLPKPRKELILGPVGYRPVNFNPDIRMSSVTIPPGVMPSESPQVETENVTASNGIG